MLFYVNVDVDMDVHNRVTMDDLVCYVAGFDDDDGGAQLISPSSPPPSLLPACVLLLVCPGNGVR
jgi:hypothetical protein